MVTITATEAARNFASTLDRVERGETVIITRAGRSIVQMTPVASANGAASKRLLTTAVDPDFAQNVTEARGMAHSQEREWQD